MTLAAGVFACSGSGGGGCGGCGGTTDGGAAYEFPGTSAEHVVFRGGQVHVTQSGLDRISSNLEPLIGSFLGDGGLSFCVPPTDITVATLCGSERCDDGSEGCQVSAALENVRIIPTRTEDPASDRIRVEVTLRINERLTTSGLISCNIDLGDRGGIPVALNAYLDVDPPEWERVHARLPGEELEFDVNDISIDFSGGVFGACNILDVATPFITGLIEDQVTGPINDALGPLLCTQCASTAECPGGSECSADGVCLFSGTEECVPLSLGVETEVDLGSLLADFAPGLDAKLGVLAYAANYADAMGPPGSGVPYEGIDLGLEIGFYSEANPCVPYAPPPANDAPAKSRAINADRTPGGDDFAVGIGVARSVLNMALWGVYRSGTLCLSVGTDTIAQISSGTFSVLLPSLGDLTGGANRPMFIQLRPQEPPTVTLGAGTVTADGEIDDPLLVVNLRNLDMDFYVYTEDRYVRLLELNADIEVPLGLDANSSGQIVVLLGDLTEAITRLEATNGNLLSEADAGRVATLLPTLIGSLLPSLAGGLIPPIDIPQIIDGVNIVIPPGGITSVDENQMLAIYADLSFGAAKEGDAHAEIADVTVEQPSFEEVEAMVSAANHQGAPLELAALTPTVALTMLPSDGERHEYSYRIDGGMWSQWRAGDVVEIRDPRLVLSGDYSIDVQTRRAGEPSSTGVGFASTAVRIDMVPPTLSVQRTGGVATVQSSDLPSEEGLTVRARVNYGAWFEVAPGETSIDLSEWSGGNALLEVEATDALGNRRVEKSMFNLDEVAVAPAAPEGLHAQEQAGCSTAPAAGPSWLGLGLLAGVLVTMRRRSARALPLAAAVVAASLAAGCNDDKSNATVRGACDPACGSDEQCVDGACVPIPCEGDDDCAEGEECTDGVCEAVSVGCDCTDEEVCVEGTCVPAETPCTIDDECPEGQQCVDGSCAAPECETADDCAACTGGQVARCEGGSCSCGEPCPEGCATGSACCASTGMCVEVSGSCGTGACEPGYRLEVDGEATFNPETCAVAFECKCTELPPLPLGFHGQWLDAAVSPDGETVAIAAYNSTYGDLMVGILQEDGTIAWTFVDGVPATGTIAGALGGPRGGISDSGPDVGLYPSIAIGADGVLHVAYHARTGDTPKQLIYARGVPAAGGEYTWSKVVADDTTNAGFYTDVVLQDDGRPLIVYAVPTFRGEDRAWYSGVRVAQPDTAEPATTEEFARFTLNTERLDLACGGACTGRSRCRADLDECQVPARASECDEDCGDGGCFENEDGTRVCAQISAGLDGVPVLYYGTGIFLDAEIIPGGEIAVAWYDHVAGNLMYIRTNTGNFSPDVAVVLDGETSGPEGPVDTGDVGWYPDLYIAADGTQYISYADHTRGTLRVIDVGARVSTPVDDGVRCYEPDPESGGCLDPLVLRVGYDSAIAPTADGLAMVYQDATWHEVLESPLTPFGWDLPGTVATGGDPYTGAYGFYLGHVDSTQGRYVFSYRINQRANPTTRDVAVIER